MIFKAVLVDSLTKIFPVGQPPPAVSLPGTVLRGEYYSFQAAYYCNEFLRDVSVQVISPLREFIAIRTVELVPAEYIGAGFDNDMVEQKNPGLFPDPLFEFDGKLKVLPKQWRSLWITVAVPEDIPPAVYAVSVFFRHPTSGIDMELSLKLKVLATILPPQGIHRTEWFHADCLAEVGGMEMWSERYWEVLEAYFRNMTAHGIDFLFTPIFTPALDTAVGHERPTTQLVEVSSLRPDQYNFNFTRLKRWIDVAHRAGFRHFEMAPLFTQWGARHAPKIVVKTLSGPEKLFGWDTDAGGASYQTFLKAFLPRLRKFLQQKGIVENCRFHLSDEPKECDLPHYEAMANWVKQFIPERLLIDTASSLEFYTKGICRNPIPPLSEALTMFMRHGVKDVWTYYANTPWKETTNRFFTMPLYRTRSLGLILYACGASGFLHWGYNFWFSRGSLRCIDPFKTTDADREFPAGDAFLVYPGKDGPIDSIRHEALREAFQDYRALQLMERRIGRKEVLAWLDREFQEQFSPRRYPRSADAFGKWRKNLFRFLEE